MNIAVIFAGGVGTRMNTKSMPKQFLELHGKPIIIYTLEIFENHSDIDGIVIACVSEWIPYLKRILSKFGICKVKKIVSGGATGQESIYNGLIAVKELYALNTTVLIHDGVRPIIDKNLISNCISSVEKYGTAITVVRAKETFVILNNYKSVSFIPERQKSVIAKAPQCFVLSSILSAHERAMSDGFNNFIDSCTMMNYYGYDLALVEGDYENIKITNPIDFYLFRAIEEARENSQIFGF